MRIMEVSITYNEELNPKIWDGFKMKPEVLEKLREIATAFLLFLDVPNLEVDDMVIIGSSANYNWTEQSDLDLHLVMDLGKLKDTCKDFTEELFDAKNDTWKERHDITIYGLPVEVYIQDNTTNKEKIEGIERHITGVFSIKDNKWLRKPSFHPPEVNDTDVKVKANAFKRKINKIVDGDLGMKYAKGLHGKIKRLRKSGLHKYGEFSTENLVFKELRNSGAMEKLLIYIRQATSEKLSLEGVEEFDSQEKTLEHLNKVQKARVLEWCYVRDRARQIFNYTGSGVSINWLQNIPSFSLDYPPAYRDDPLLSQNLKHKLKVTFDRMFMAKKEYEDHGGKYKRIHESVDFENHQASLKDLNRVQQARSLEYVRARDYLYQKYGLRNSGSPVNHVQHAKSFEIRFASPLDELIEDHRLTNEEAKKILAVWKRMIDAKTKYEYWEQRAPGYEWLAQQQE